MHRTHALAIALRPLLPAAGILALCGLAGCSLAGTRSVPLTPTDATMGSPSAQLQSLLRPYSVLPPWAQISASGQRRPALVPPQQSQRDFTGTIVYVTNFGTSSIDCFGLTSSGSTYLGSITSGLDQPQGEAVTQGPADKQRLVVANTYAQNVLIYEGKCRKARVVRTLDDSVGLPTGVATADNHNIYVTNIRDNSSANGEVRLYTANDNVGVKIGDPHLTNVYFVAVKRDDSQICVDGFETGTPNARIDCSKNHGSTWVTLNDKPKYPGGLAFDKLGHLVVDDQEGNITDLGNGITFPCPNNGDCIDIAFASDFHHLFAAAQVGGQSYEFAWVPGPAGQIDATMPSQGIHPDPIAAQPVPGV